MGGASTRDGAPRAFLLAAAALGIALRLAFGLGYWTHQPLTRDEQEYLSLARSVAAGRGFVYDEVMRSGSFVPFGRAPGYPTFLALVGGGARTVDAVPTSVKIAQAVVGALGVWLVGLTAYRLGGTRAARAAAVIAACYPPLVWISGYAYSEAIFWPLGLGVAWLFDRAWARGDDWRAALLAGLVTGLGILIRPALLLFCPLAGVLLLRHRRPRALAGLTLGVLLIVGPWTVRNYREHGRVMIVASDGGVTFWTGNHPLATGDGDMAANEALKRDNRRLRAEHPGLTEEAMEPIYYREALAWIRTHPLTWVGLEGRKLFFLIVPIGPSYTLHSRLYYVTSAIAYGAILLLALAGFGRIGGRQSRTPGLWLMAAAAVLVCLVFFPQERFRIPVIDPVLVILAGAGIAGRRREAA